MCPPLGRRSVDAMRQALTTRNSVFMLGALAVAVAGAAAPPAHATYAGKNGPIAFQRFTGGQEDAEIFSMSPTGRRAHRLTAGPGAIFNPDFSPNGSQLAFERRYGDDPTRKPDAIFTVKSSGGRATKISSGCTGQCLGDDGPAWSPDGGQILFTRAFGPIVKDAAAELDLMVMNRDGSGQRLIRRFAHVDGLAPGSEGKAQFSPDGQQIAVTLLGQGTDPRRSSSAVYLMNTDGSNLRPITPAKLHGGNADWSPNGKLLVFHSNNYTRARSEIWVVKPNGKGRRRLRRSHLGRDYQPVWSPDGRQIAFGHDAPAVHKGGHVLHPGPNLWTMRSDGSHAHAITNPVDKPMEITPDWGAR